LEKKKDIFIIIVQTIIHFAQILLNAIEIKVDEYVLLLILMASIRVVFYNEQLLDPDQPIKILILQVRLLISVSL